MAIIVKLDDVLHARRMTLTELSVRIDITLANLSILKTGKARAIRFSTLDAIWVLNGVIYWILLFATGQWTRIVPTGWDVFPHAVSVAIQYASLDWPLENGWVNYNALQLLTYFVTVFVAAPLAIL